MTGRVIAISGPPGSGKTTLGRWLANEIGASRVNYDDYEIMTKKPPNVIMDWLSRGAPLAEIEAPGLDDAVVTACQTGDVVFETHLGRAWGPTSKLIDISIYLDTPLDLALARNLQSYVQAWARQGGTLEQSAAWFAGHLKAYEDFIRPSLLVQAERVKAQADHLVNTEGELRRAQDAIMAILSD